MTEYYEEGGLLYEQSPPMHIKVESPEGALGGAASEDGFPREDEDSDGSCDQSSGLPGGLPFNVVVVHPNIMAPSLSSDDLLSMEQTRGVSSALAAGGVGKRKSRFSGAELEVLVSEVTRCEGELFGPAGRLRRRERERIWAGILERVNAVSRVPRTLREVKKRWDDLKRRNGGRLADARHRSCYLPPGRGSSMFGRSSQASPGLHQNRHKQSSRGKTTFPCFTDSDAGGGEGSERDGLEKEEDGVERERDGEVGEPECEGAESSMEEKLGLGLGLGIGPPPVSDRWLPPSPLYSAPFLNGSPPPSPQPSLGAQQGPLEAPPRSWLEDELRGLGDAALQLGDRVEQSLRDFGEGFRRDFRTLAASQDALAHSLQQNNVLLQRLLGVLEAQHQPQTQPVQQQHRIQQTPQPSHQQVPQQPQQQQQQQQPPPQPSRLQQVTQQLQLQQQPQEHQPHIQQLLQHPSNQPTLQQLPQHPSNQTTLPQPPQHPSTQPTLPQLPQHPCSQPTLPQLPQHLSNQPTLAVLTLPPPPDLLDGTFHPDPPTFHPDPPAFHPDPPTFHPDPPTSIKGTVPRPRRGRTLDHRRRRRR